jgi:histidyl-tRNA synthetase
VTDLSGNTKKIKAIRGMNDILPDKTPMWRALEASVVRILHQYGYEEIRTPMIEKTDVFAGTVGESSDIVQKEMYSFEDRNSDRLTLRPEGTAGCARAVLEHQLYRTLPLRLWYLGPMFRYERPQRGRHRQFHQIGVESYGLAGPNMDVEIIQLGARLWQALGFDNLTLELNSLGTAVTRREYRKVLTEYFSSHDQSLDEDSKKRLRTNPLRILDSKTPEMAEVVKNAPPIIDYLDSESSDHFEEVKELLSRSGIKFFDNSKLVRGLDYYTKTVFEWKTKDLGAQDTICAGGRYDSLMESIGGPSIPAVGLAMGLERLIQLNDAQVAHKKGEGPDLYLLGTEERFDQKAILLAESLRDQQDKWSVLVHLGGGSLKSRMKKADRSNATLAIIIGPEEDKKGEVTIRPLRSDDKQFRCRREQIGQNLLRFLIT